MGSFPGNGLTDSHLKRESGWMCCDKRWISHTVLNLTPHMAAVTGPVRKCCGLFEYHWSIWGVLEFLWDVNVLVPLNGRTQKSVWTHTDARVKNFDASRKADGERLSVSSAQTEDHVWKHDAETNYVQTQRATQRNLLKQSPQLWTPLGHLRVRILLPASCSE